MLAAVPVLSLLLSTAAPAVEPPGAAVRLDVTVLDEAGKPLAGARLRLVSPAPDGTFDVYAARFPDNSSRADEGGRFTFRTSPGKVIVAASRFTASGVTVRFAPVSVGASGASAVVRFDGGARIRGMTLGPKGEPLGGVWVTGIPERTGERTARGDAIVVRVRTGDDGTFDLWGLAPGPHRLTARGAGYRCVEACAYGEGMPARTGDDHVNIPLGPLGSITGRVVTLDAGGTPQPVKDFVVYSNAFGSGRMMDDEGRFEIEVPRLWKGASLFIYARGVAPHVTKFDLLEPVVRDLGELEVGPGRTVRGTVREASGRPIEGARVGVGYGEDVLQHPMTLYDTEGPYEVPATVTSTDAAGRFEIPGVQAGPAPLSITHVEYRAVNVTAGRRDAAVDVTLSPSVKLSVRVEEPDGSPVAGAQVWNVISRTQCQTGRDGTCVLGGLERTEQVLEARLPNAARPPTNQLRVPIGPGPGAPPTAVFRMPRKPSHLRVTVVEPDGTFAQATVQAIVGDVPSSSALDAKGEPDRPYHGGGIDLQKRLENLAPGRYTVLGRSIDTLHRCGVQRVELKEGEDLAVVVKLPPDAGPCRP
jgi:protocatechuate 3,4-dioxygenase beta subunit